MEINILPFNDVQKAIPGAQNEWQRIDQYNTNMHSHTEIAAVIPEDSFRHVYPDLTIEHFSDWASLIVSSQGVHEWHEFHLSTSLVQQLIGAHNLWMAMRPIRQDIKDDMVDFFPQKTIHGVSSKSVFGGKKWFLRLDFCSAKDGSLGTKPIKSLDDVLAALYTSKRATTELKEMIAEPSSRPARLFLLLYTDRMDPAREYRVFCPPRKERITAISQYRWFEPFYIRDAKGAERAADKIWKGALRIHEQILQHAEGLCNANVKEKLRSEGFVFDVFEGDANDVQLIEINPFGAMSGCGSCLFHRIRDARVIYGEKEKVEVRIAM